MTLDDSPRLKGANAGREQEPSDRLVPRLLALLDTGLNRLGLRGSFSRDLLLGVLVALVSLAMLVSLTLLAQAEGREFALAAVATLAGLTCAQSLVLCVRRHTPLLCLSVVVAAQVGTIALLPSDAAFQGPASFFVAYTCGTVLSLRRLFWVLMGVTAVLGLCGVVFALPPFTSLSPPAEVWGHPLVAGATRTLSAVFSYGVLGFIGNDVATRRRFVQFERRREVEAQRERTNGAIRAERTRMARELHDIAAHHLSGVVVQAGAAEQLVGRDDRAARETTTWIRSQGKEILENLRMVIGTLRDPGEYPQDARDETDDGEPRVDGATVPGIAMLDHLVEGERALGSEVILERTGRPYDLPPVADITFYRVAQESLANARDHAGGARVRVELHYQESEIVLQVENASGVEREESSKDVRGLGLVGMRERAALIGATLEAGPTDSGMWRIRLTLPFTRRVLANRADHATAKEAPHDQGGPGG